MRIARVIGTVTLSPKAASLKIGRLLIADVLDHKAIQNLPRVTQREKPMPESLVVFDELGAGVGQMIAVSEGREAAMPFYPTNVPIDAYNAAILDSIEWTTK